MIGIIIGSALIGGTVLILHTCLPRKKGRNVYYFEEEGQIKPVVVQADSLEDDNIKDRIYRETLEEKGFLYAWTTAGSPLLKQSNKYKIIFWFLTFLIFPTWLKIIDFVKNKKVRFIFLILPFLILRLVVKKYYGVSVNETK